MLAILPAIYLVAGIVIQYALMRHILLDSAMIKARLTDFLEGVERREVFADAFVSGELDPERWAYDERLHFIPGWHSTETLHMIELLAHFDEAKLTGNVSWLQLRAEFAQSGAKSIPFGSSELLKPTRITTEYALVMIEWAPKYVILTVNGQQHLAIPRASNSTKPVQLYSGHEMEKLSMRVVFTSSSLSEIRPKGLPENVSTSLLIDRIQLFKMKCDFWLNQTHNMTNDNPAGDGKDFDIDSVEGGPVSSFQSYAAEGDILAKQGDYRKAIEAYSKACRARLPLALDASLARRLLTRRGVLDPLAGTVDGATRLGAC
nr:hypothetical protein HK105_006695 [Polyrhizophydium stewartii]